MPEDFKKRDLAIAFVRVLFRARDSCGHRRDAGTLHQLAQSPRSWEALRAQPDRAAQAFDEAIRHVSQLASYVRYSSRGLRGSAASDFGATSGPEPILLRPTATHANGKTRIRST